jgi:glutathione S-transferase
MDLFYTPNTISVACAIALEEAGLKYSRHLIEFSKGQQSSENYLKINPKGRVPALVVDDNILTETGAILEYIASQAPKSELVPTSTLQLFRMREVMYYLASTMHVAHAHKFRSSRWADRPESWEDMAAKVDQTMGASCAYFEDNYAFDPFVLGTTLSVADIYLFVITTWLPGDGVEVANYPQLSRFIDTMNKRTSVQSLRAAGMLR